MIMLNNFKEGDIDRVTSCFKQVCKLHRAATTSGAIDYRVSQ